jgi:hypothetical protein
LIEQCGIANLRGNTGHFLFAFNLAEWSKMLGSKQGDPQDFDDTPDSVEK